MTAPDATSLRPCGDAAPSTTARSSGTERSSVTDPIAAFAYLRRLPSADDATINRTVKELIAFTEQKCLALAGVHFEDGPGERLDTWMELIVGCRREGVVHILVPHPGHFHPDPAVAAFMREELAEKIRGTVWYVNEAPTPATTEAVTVTSEAGSRDQ
jgi:hypothetical protein